MSQEYKLDLMKFCGIDDVREFLHTPFSDKDYTYATNGHVCIRVPLIEEWKDKTAPINPNEKLFKDLGRYRTFIPIPAVPETALFEQCPECRDTVNQCETCGGSGEIECSECNQIRECEDCEGPCYKCSGSGKVYTEKNTPIRISVFNQAYVWLISQLPNCQISIIEKNGMAYFKFDGGDGCLMPLRQ
jgi:hypothetical protein